MYKEILHNIQKHAHATQVQILIHEDFGNFTTTIEDNGIGFDPAALSSGNGLTNLKNRASSLKAKFEIDSAPERGTRVMIAVPMH